MKKALRETQTLRAGCKAEPKIFAQPQTPFPAPPLKVFPLELGTGAGVRKLK